MCAFIEVKLPRDKVNRKAKVRKAFVLKNYFAKIEGFWYFMYPTTSNNFGKDTLLVTLPVHGT